MGNEKTIAMYKASKGLSLALTGVGSSAKSQKTRNQLGTFSWSIVVYIMEHNGTFTLILFSKAEPSQQVPC